MTYVQLEINNNPHYAILTIDRPKALNALNPEVLKELHESILELQEKKVRAVIVTGSGEKAFVAGADIAEMKDFSTDQALMFAELGHRTMNAFAGSEVITVAAINGFALGGGLELALACDMRFASENAKMGLPEVTLGLIPGFGGTQRLPRIVGRGIALEMILSGDMIDAARAQEIGLVNRVCAPDRLLEETRAFVEGMLKHRSAVAQRMARWSANVGLDDPLPAGLQREINNFSELFATSDPKTGLSAFLEKKKPEF